MIWIEAWARWTGINAGIVALKARPWGKLPVAIVAMIAIGPRRNVAGIVVARVSIPGRTIVVSMVARQGLWPIAAGVTAGLTGFALSARLIERFMFALTPVNAWTFAALAGAVALIAVVAMLLPARRALNVDPAITLRAE